MERPRLRDTVVRAMPNLIGALAAIACLLVIPHLWLRAGEGGWIERLYASGVAVLALVANMVSACAVSVCQTRESRWPRLARVLRYIRLGVLAVTLFYLVYVCLVALLTPTAGAPLGGSQVRNPFLSVSPTSVTSSTGKKRH